MLEPYSAIQDKESHGDIIVWPLKALCDYIEATGDFAFLDETIAWRREDNFAKTVHADPVAAHVDKLIETVRARFIPGHNLVPLWQRRLERFASAGRPDEARLDDERLDGRSALRAASPLRRNPSSGEACAQARPRSSTRLPPRCARTSTAYLIREGIVAGYGVFRPEGGEPELLLHPSDNKPGSRFSLLPMTQSMIGGLFTQAQARRHLEPHPQSISFFPTARA